MNQTSTDNGTATRVPRIQLQDVRVTFGATVALAGESLELMPGEIVGLLGHNGAGKSTLVNVATGALKPDAGKMLVDGEEVSLSGRPVAMEREGIKVIHQEPALVPNLSISDNVALASPHEGASRAKKRQAAKEALARVGGDYDVDRPVATLDLGSRQVVDLARAISGEIRCLFLDEPTGALGQKEADRLHTLLRSLAGDGRAIVYVSHRMRDIVEVCDRIVVLREGRVVMRQPTHGLSAQDLAEALSPGVDLAHREAKGSSEEVTLDVKWRDQHLSFRRGEIVGLFGMAAGPQYQLMSDLFGLGQRPDATLVGHPYSPTSPSQAIQRRVFLVTADRERDALLPDMSALDNLVMPWIRGLVNRGSISRSSSKAIYNRAKEALDIRGASDSTPISAFSGGNRQKHVLGRWLYGRAPTVLLLCQPVQGVDVGARADIAKTLRAAADEGVTVVVASSETDEIATLCDRVVVCEGEQWQPIARSADWEQQMLEGLLARSDRKN